MHTLIDSTRHDGKLVMVPLARIAPPVGWRARYTIHARPEQLETVLAWFARGCGISVRQSQYIGDGSTAFQPSDDNGQPHWKFGELTDSVPANECVDVFRIVKLEVVTDACVPDACRYCLGTGTHTTNKALEEQTAASTKCEACGVHTGFSFLEPWHHESIRRQAGTMRARVQRWGLLVLQWDRQRRAYAG